MQRERHLLVTQVIPELRRICADRFVTFTEVDLRWGITEEQAAEGKVLPICLREIQHTRPYFIGILGERYGWIPQNLSPELRASEKWLDEHVGKRTSVTELEILHGVLQNPEMAGHAFFYFRDAKWIESLTDEAERHEFSEHDLANEIEALGPAVAAERTAERKARLAALKQRIRDSRLPLVDPYSSPEALADLVRMQFLELIDKHYPREQIPDPLAKEALDQDSFATRKLLGYVPRPTHTEPLDTYVSVESNRQSDPLSLNCTGLVITGESGSGKTALLADWVQQWRKSHPADWIFVHYFGSTPDSTSVPRFLTRLLGELKRCYDIKDEIPSSPKELNEALPYWLDRSSGKGRVVLVIDALNQIEGSDSDRCLTWLPQRFPPHVRVLASTLPGTALEILLKRQWIQQPLPLTNATERGAMIDAFLDHYCKSLSNELRSMIVEADGSSNPLFLRTVLEELRQYGCFERLPAKVAEYLAATTPAELFRLVLRRWQKDLDAGSNLTLRAMRYLWAARMGLSETEWLDLLGAAAAPLQRQTWAPLYFAMEPHLTLRSGLVTFGHDYLRQAVQAEFLSSNSDAADAHLALADYFEKQESNPRKAEELPWQLRQSSQRDRLRRSLLDIPLFLLAQKRSRRELLQYWTWLDERLLMGQLYLQAFDQWARGKDETTIVSSAASDVSSFLFFGARQKEAEPLMRRALKIDARQFGTNHPSVAKDLRNLHALLMAGDRFLEAEPLIRRGLSIDQKVHGKDHPAVAIDLFDLASLLMATNRFAEAEPLIRQGLRIDECHYGKDDLEIASDLNLLASYLKNGQRFSEAESLLQRALSIVEKNLGPESAMLGSILNNLATALMGSARHVEAESFLRRALQIQEHVSGEDHPAVARQLNNLAVLLKKLGRLEEAEPLMRRTLEIDERNYGETHPDIALDLTQLASLMAASNRAAEAEQLMQRAVEILVNFERSTSRRHPNRDFLSMVLREVYLAMGYSRVQVLNMLRQKLP